MGAWFEDESFWSTFYPYMFSDENIERAEEQVEKLLQLVDFQGRTVLDLACGPGRHSVVLAGRGYQVTGVDLTSYLLEKARERAASAGVEVEWVQADMRRFVRPEAFDLALSMFTSFGYFQDRDDDRLVLRNLYRSLKPGGVLVIDVAGKEWLARRFEATDSEELADGVLMVQRRAVRDGWSRLHNEWILIKDGRVDSFEIEHTIYSGQELIDRLSEAGFENLRLYGDLDGNDYDLEAKRLIAVARK